jgi:hypothetical protein
MDTLVVVQCWSGDVDRVKRALDQYTHHGFPILLLSPTDAPARIDHPMITCESAGPNDYNGQQSIERYKAQLALLLEYPVTHFLLNESDSFCIEPNIPGYLYSNDDFVWGNYTDVLYYMELNGEPNPEAAYVKHNPAIQAPWFFSRTALEKMVAVFDDVVDALPSYARYIDWWFHTAPHLAGLDHRSYASQGISYPITNTSEADHVYQAILRGAVMIHSVKDSYALKNVLRAYEERKRLEDPHTVRVSTT